MATSNDDPLKQLIELLVYAPAGLLVEARRLYPSIVEAGRQQVDNQVRLARFVGEFAVGHGRRVAGQRLSEFLHPRPASAPTVAPGEAAEADRPVDAPATATAPDVLDSAALAVDGYDTLAASQIVPRLVGLSTSDLDMIGRYEAAHRARRTILGQITRLRPAAS